MESSIIKWFLNKDWLVWIRPSKKSKQKLILEYISNKIPPIQTFTEKEFNQLLISLHTFNDVALVRRELYINKFIDRTLDGKIYWKQI